LPRSSGRLLSGRGARRVLLLLSGEHQTIPCSEALAVLQTEGVEFKTVSRSDQVLILDAGNGACSAIEGRAAFTMEGGRFLFSAEPSLEDVKLKCGMADWSFLGGRSFGVKVTRVREYFRGVDTQEVQGEIGYSIKKQTGSSVDLRTPDFWIRGVLTDGGFFAFSLDFTTDRKAFSARRPKTRPYFHPGVLHPKIARAFVNLSRVKKGAVFIDPFCGTGGFLIEGALLGCQTCGMDLDPRMINGARQNLAHYQLEADLIHGDARDLPLDRADGIATDPPYGRGASTMGENVKGILSGFFREGYRTLDKGSYLCTAAPLEIGPRVLAEEAGFTVREEHRMRVHKSLTRSIIVAERT
jgi:tRNA (guanine10-N2)-dimethyltransferase